MSKYHKSCTKPEDPEPRKSKSRTGGPIISKPFCDCRGCMCKNCPDILKMLSITVTETSCDFGSKVVKCNSNRTTPRTSKQDEPERNSLLDVLNADRDCGCEVVARAVRANVHMNLGLSDLRGGTQTTDKTSKDIAPGQ